MNDNEIVALYWERSESAIQETEKKYGHYLRKIAYNILSDQEDSKESVNDTYLSAWNTIPPQKPKELSSYLTKIARRISIDKFRKRTRKKRKSTEYALSLSELDENLSVGNITEQTVDLHLLGAAINAYLRTLPEESRNTFIARYYFADSIRSIAEYLHISESKAKTLLFRTRAGLKEYLKQEGFLNER